MLALALAIWSLESDPLLQFSIRQWRGYPEMRIEDAYKWLFHATLGGEHAVQDDDAPRQWLDMEWPTVEKPMHGEPEVVKLRPDGKAIRINLRPYKHRGGDKEMLLAVFVASARAFHADKRDFVNEWRSLGRDLQQRRIGKITFAEWKRLNAVVSRSNFPAIDHSTAYERVYKPAYRVVLSSLWR